MRFFKEFWLGITAYPKAIAFIHKHKLWWYALLPAALLLIVFHLGNRLLNRQLDYDFTNMNGIVWYCIQASFEILLALTLMKFTKYIVVIVLSPLISYLSQKCERIIGTPNVTTSWKDFKSDIIRSAKLSMRNMIWEYSIFILLVLISIIGWDDVKSSPIYYLSFIVGFYFYGFSFLDYHNERIRRSAEDAIEYTQKHIGLAMGIGAIYSLFISFPIQLNYLFIIDPKLYTTWETWWNFALQFILWIGASFAPILSIVAATISSNQLEGKFEKKIVVENETTIG